ncbi:hypothetical protein FOZ63_028415 [Perkinsus olseni]|uniref:protein-serine/threonine phosphatase n=2 Tax=Perkinsus olseni TaxID=32597 RepID=A0A7J6RXN6_PEROL|nr:hypothetical protein FOZ63_028415 [Perkinsus olseni]
MQQIPRPNYRAPAGPVALAYNALRDMYVLLLVLAVAELITRSDFLHFTFRWYVIIGTAYAVARQLVSWVFSFIESYSGQGTTALTGVSGLVGPRTQKFTRTGSKGSSLSYVVSEMQGWRDTMEDACICLLDMEPPLSDSCLFAVFDGHGGSMVAKLCAQSFPLEICRHAKNELLRMKKESEGTTARDADEEGGSSTAKKRHHHRLNILHNHRKEQQKTAKSEEGRESDESTNTAEDVDSDDNFDEEEVEATPELMAQLDFGKILTTTYMEMDALLESTGKLTPPKEGSIENALKHLPIGNPSMAMSGIERRNMFDFTGSTAVVALVRNGVITVANCGDSRAVLCRNGRAVELSHDHKPESPSERRRIENAGGKVMSMGPCHRIDWGLNLSRALGDFVYKRAGELPAEDQKVSPMPDVVTEEITDEDEFMVLACDGVFELLSSQDVVDFVSRRLENGEKLHTVVEALLDECCSRNPRLTQGRGTDNETCVIVSLNGVGTSGASSHTNVTADVHFARGNTGKAAAASSSARPARSGGDAPASSEEASPAD